MDYRELRSAWCLGSEEFRKELLASMQERARPNHCGADRRERSEEKAHRIVMESLTQLGWRESDLGIRPKVDNTRSRSHVKCAQKRP
jgi:hypothetical protein